MRVSHRPPSDRDNPSPPQKNRNNNEHRTRLKGAGPRWGGWRAWPVAASGRRGRCTRHAQGKGTLRTAHPMLHSTTTARQERSHRISPTEGVHKRTRTDSQPPPPPPFYGGGPGEPHSKVRKSYKEYRSSLVQSPTRRAFQPRARQHSSHAFFVAAALRQRQPSEAGVASHLGRAILGGAPRCPRAPQPAPSSLTRARRAERAPQAPPLALPRGRPRALDRERAFYCIGRRRQRSRELRSPAGHPQAARQADRWAR